MDNVIKNFAKRAGKLIKGVAIGQPLYFVALYKVDKIFGFATAEVKSGEKITKQAAPAKKHLSKISNATPEDCESVGGVLIVTGEKIYFLLNKGGAKKAFNTKKADRGLQDFFAKAYPSLKIKNSQIRCAPFEQSLIDKLTHGGMMTRSVIKDLQEMDPDITLKEAEELSVFLQKIDVSDIEAKNKELSSALRKDVPKVTSDEDRWAAFAQRLTDGPLPVRTQEDTVEYDLTPLREAVTILQENPLDTEQGLHVETLLQEAAPSSLPDSEQAQIERILSAHKQLTNTAEVISITTNTLLSNITSTNRAQALSTWMEHFMGISGASESMPPYSKGVQALEKHKAVCSIILTIAQYTAELEQNISSQENADTLKKSCAQLDTEYQDSIEYQEAISLLATHDQARTQIQELEGLNQNFRAKITSTEQAQSIQEKLRYFSFVHKSSQESQELLQAHNNLIDARKKLRESMTIMNIDIQSDSAMQNLTSTMAYYISLDFAQESHEEYQQSLALKQQHESCLALSQEMRELSHSLEEDLESTTLAEKLEDSRSKYIQQYPLALQQESTQKAQQVLRNHQSLISLLQTVQEQEQELRQNALHESVSQALVVSLQKYKQHPGFREQNQLFLSAKETIEKAKQAKDYIQTINQASDTLTQNLYSIDAAQSLEILIGQAESYQLSQSIAVSNARQNISRHKALVERCTALSKAHEELVESLLSSSAANALEDEMGLFEAQYGADSSQKIYQNAGALLSQHYLLAQIKDKMELYTNHLRENLTNKSVAAHLKEQMDAFLSIDAKNTKYVEYSEAYQQYQKHQAAQKYFEQLQEDTAQLQKTLHTQEKALQLESSMDLFLQYEGKKNDEVYQAAKQLLNSHYTCNDLLDKITEQTEALNQTIEESSLALSLSKSKERFLSIPHAHSEHEQIQKAQSILHMHEKTLELLDLLEHKTTILKDHIWSVPLATEAQEVENRFIQETKHPLRKDHDFYTLLQQHQNLREHIQKMSAIDQQLRDTLQKPELGFELKALMDTVQSLGGMEAIEYGQAYGTLKKHETILGFIEQLEKNEQKLSTNLISLDAVATLEVALGVYIDNGGDKTNSIYQQSKNTIKKHYHLTSTVDDLKRCESELGLAIHDTSKGESLTQKIEYALSIQGSEYIDFSQADALKKRHKHTLATISSLEEETTKLLADIHNTTQIQSLEMTMGTYEAIDGVHLGIEAYQNAQKTVKAHYTLMEIYNALVGSVQTLKDNLLEPLYAQALQILMDEYTQHPNGSTDQSAYTQAQDTIQQHEECTLLITELSQALAESRTNPESSEIASSLQKQMEGYEGHSCFDAQNSTYCEAQQQLLIHNTWRSALEELSSASEALSQDLENETIGQQLQKAIDELQAIGASKLEQHTKAQSLLLEHKNQCLKVNHLEEARTLLLSDLSNVAYGTQLVHALQAYFALSFKSNARITKANSALAEHAQFFHQELQKAIEQLENEPLSKPHNHHLTFTLSQYQQAPEQEQNLIKQAQNALVAHTEALNLLKAMMLCQNQLAASLSNPHQDNVHHAQNLLQEFESAGCTHTVQHSLSKILSSYTSSIEFLKEVTQINTEISIPAINTPPEVMKKAQDVHMQCSSFGALYMHEEIKKLQESCMIWEASYTHYLTIQEILNTLPPIEQCSAAQEPDFINLRTSIIAYESVGGASTEVIESAKEILKAWDTREEDVFFETEESFEEVEITDVYLEPLNNSALGETQDFPTSEKENFALLVSQSAEALANDLEKIEQQEELLERHQEGYKEAQTELIRQFDINDDTDMSELLELTFFSGIKTVSMWQKHAEKLNTKIRSIPEQKIVSTSLKLSIQHYQKVLIPISEDFTPLEDWCAQQRQFLSSGMLTESQSISVKEQIQQRQDRIHFIREALNTQSLPMNLALQLSLDRFQVQLTSLASLLHEHTQMVLQYKERLRSNALNIIAETQRMEQSYINFSQEISSAVSQEYASHIENIDSFPLALSKALQNEFKTIQEVLNTALTNFIDDYNDVHLQEAITSARSHTTQSKLFELLHEAPYAHGDSPITMMESILGKIQQLSS